ncbi:hypothetical protein Q8A67_006157 [Cirrhinus molitorella]|uniref:TRIM8/14/16/25/29/45/65 coiled-coil region domain-containing protein n=1 Tax=Cirrhinus molitorella TaxID=172907 RepID=A0AA88Q4M4_9TELE|nr:hypothetical protein Q8A67_006157 [Cirrhinus molitorella]
MTEKQHQLKETQKMFQETIQQREKVLQQLRETVESHKRSAQTAVEDSERIFTELIRSIERSRTELIRLIRDQERAVVSQTEGQLERLKQEINDLRRTDAELEQLSHTQDHIQFLQSFQSLPAPPEFTDVNDGPSISLFCSDGLRESVCQLRDKLEDIFKEQVKKIFDRVTFTNIVSRTRKDFLQYFHQLTLDLNTVHKYIRLSVNNTVISVAATKQLKETQKMFQQRIQEIEKDLQQPREAVGSHKCSAVEDSERIFTELIRSSIEKSCSELIRLIRDQEKAAVGRAEGRLEQLEQEINDLRRRDVKLEQLSHTQDHIQFLQDHFFATRHHRRTPGFLQGTNQLQSANLTSTAAPKADNRASKFTLLDTSILPRKIWPSSSIVSQRQAFNKPGPCPDLTTTRPHLPPTSAQPLARVPYATRPAGPHSACLLQLLLHEAASASGTGYTGSSEIPSECHKHHSLPIFPFSSLKLPSQTSEPDLSMRLRSSSLHLYCTQNPNILFSQQHLCLSYQMLSP